MTKNTIPAETRAAIRSTITAMLYPFGVPRERLDTALGKFLAIVDGTDANAVTDATPIGRIITAKMAADILGCTTRTVRYYAKRGILRPAATTNRRVRGYTEESVRSAVSGKSV